MGGVGAFVSMQYGKAKVEWSVICGGYVKRSVLKSDN